MSIFAVFWAICGFLIYRFIDRKLRACPNCKRGASGAITHTEKEPLGTQVDHAGKNPEQIISERVTDHYECKHCGHTWMRTFERKQRVPIEKKSFSTRRS